jgi:hypothetical protein
MVRLRVLHCDPGDDLAPLQRVELPPAPGFDQVAQQRHLLKVRVRVKARAIGLEGWPEP